MAEYDYPGRCFYRGGCNIGANVYIENGVKLGNHVKVKNNIDLYSGIECEDGVFLGPNCVFTNVLNPRAFIEKKSEFQKTIIRKGATVGANATIICGHEIGEYSLIGAGAVVTKDIPPYSLVMGNPGRCVGYVCQCGETLQKETDIFICRKCDKKYQIREESLCKLDE